MVEAGIDTAANVPGAKLIIAGMGHDLARAHSDPRGDNCGTLRAGRQEISDVARFAWHEVIVRSSRRLLAPEAPVLFAAPPVLPGLDADDGKHLEYDLFAAVGRP